MALPLKGVNNLTGIYQCCKDSRSALDIRKILELKSITVQESHMGKSASFVAEYLLQNVIQNPPKLKLVTNAKQEVEIENTIRGLFIYQSYK